MYLLSVPSVSSSYFNKIKRTSHLGKSPALSLEILMHFAKSPSIGKGAISDIYPDSTLGYFP